MAKTFFQNKSGEERDQKNRTTDYAFTVNYFCVRIRDRGMKS